MALHVLTRERTRISQSTGIACKYNWQFQEKHFTILTFYNIDFKGLVWCGTTRADKRKKQGLSINCCHMHPGKVWRKTSRFHLDGSALPFWNRKWIFEIYGCQMAYPKWGWAEYGRSFLAGRVLPWYMAKLYRQWYMAKLYRQWYVAKLYRPWYMAIRYKL